jgi:hypothetical protein
MRVEALTVVNIKIMIRDVMPCRLADGCQYLGGICCIHLEGRGSEPGARKWEYRGE